MCINMMQGSDVIFLMELRPMLAHVVRRALIWARLLELRSRGRISVSWPGDFRDELAQGAIGEACDQVLE